MNISISSPDGIGDFVLRQPLLRALETAGHRLQLCMRMPAADLARAIFPAADMVEIGSDPYHAATAGKWWPFRKEFARVKKFSPDIFLAPLFHRTVFEERWLNGPGRSCRTICFADSGGNDCVRVKVGVPELEKNRLFSHALPGCPEPGPWPTIEVSEKALNEAGGLLERHGVSAGAFLAVCVGGRPGIRVKDWGESRWSILLGQIALQNGLPLVFLGNAREGVSIDRIRSALPGAVRHMNLAASPISIESVLGILKLSSAYVGRDSGLMHMACAVNCPVLAIFGGAHWGRFLPSSGPAVAVTKIMPCRGCNFDCLYHDPLCVTEVPIELMWQGWEMLGSLGPREVKILEAPACETKKDSDNLVRASPWT